MVRVAGRRGIPAALAWVLALVACGPAGPEAQTAALEQSRTALAAGDASAALAAARAGLGVTPDAPELRLAAAQACLRLERWSEAIEHASAGRAAAPAPGLLADLHWGEGKAAMGRFRQLGSEPDWRMANVALESATEGPGAHSAEAALLLVLLQELSPRGSTERMARFVTWLEHAQPGSPEATQAAERLAKRRAAAALPGADVAGNQGLPEAPDEPVRPAEPDQP